MGVRDPGRSGAAPPVLARLRVQPLADRRLRGRAGDRHLRGRRVRPRARGGRARRCGPTTRCATTTASGRRAGSWRSPTTRSAPSSAPAASPTRAASRLLEAVLIKRRDRIGRYYLPRINPIVDPVARGLGRAVVRRTPPWTTAWRRAPRQYAATWYAFDNAAGTRVAHRARRPARPPGFRLPRGCRRRSAPSCAWTSPPRTPSTRRGAGRSRPTSAARRRDGSSSGWPPDSAPTGPVAPPAALRLRPAASPTGRAGRRPPTSAPDGGRAPASTSRGRRRTRAPPSRPPRP